MSSHRGVPHVVNITVYGAKGLKPKKDKHKFCVIFGVGKSKYRTDVVEDLFDNPVFNKEAEITVDNLDLELKFKVTEKNEKDVLGQVVVPLFELGEQSMSSPHKVPLRPHKKCPTPHGMLVFEAWVMQKKVEKIPSRSTSLDNLKSIKSIGISSGLKKLKERIGASGKSSEEKNKKSSSESLFSLKSRSAVSCQDMTRESHFVIPADRRSLHSDSIEPIDFLDSISEPSHKRNSLFLDKVSEFSGPRPEVTGVSPKTGPETGGTVLTIRGSNLGQNQEDIVALNVCGSDVLATLEYISPWKLQCRTLPWNPCVGNISVETLSGGRGTSLVEFAFHELEKPKLPTGNNSDSYLLHSPLPNISEESKFEANAQGHDDLLDSEDYGLAVPYSDNQTENSAQLDELDPKQHHIDTTPPDKTSPIFSGEDGVIRLSVGGNEPAFKKDDDEDEFPAFKHQNLGSRASVDVTNDAFQSNLVSNEALDEDLKNGIKKGDLVSKVEVSRTKILVQNGSNFTEILTGQDNRSDGKTGVASRGMPAKLPPPVVEIQPMRMEEKSNGSLQGKGSDGAPPRKPPRQFPGRRNSGQKSSDEIDLFSPSQKIIDQDDVFPEKITLTEDEQVKVSDLEMQLMKKTNEIEMLVQLKKSLVDENWRLKQYIEALVMRAIKICPEVLCIDDSFA